MGAKAAKVAVPFDNNVSAEWQILCHFLLILSSKLFKCDECRMNEWREGNNRHHGLTS